MRRIAALTMLVLLSSALASAGPIVPRDIAADAKWFGHVDFEAVRSLKIVQDFKDKCPEYPRWQAKAQELSEKLGMNPIEDVLGVTLYSDRYGEHAAVVLVYVKKVDREKMLGFLKEKHPGYKTSEYGSHTLYSWQFGRKGHKQDVTGAFASDTLIVMARDAQPVKAALDVLAGTADKNPGLAKDAPLLQGIPETALVAARASDIPEEFRKTARCWVLASCKSATVFWTEKDGELTKKAQFTTTSAKAATDLKDLVVGFKGLVDLCYGQVPAIAKALDGITAEAEGDSFTSTFTISTADAEAVVRAVLEHKVACPFFGAEHGPKGKHREKK